MPWPATLVHLASGRGGHTPSAEGVDGHHLAHGFALLARTLVSDQPFAPGKEVWAISSSRWRKGKVVRRVEPSANQPAGGYTVRLNRGGQTTNPPAKVLSVREGGAGALLREAAVVGSVPLLEALLEMGVSVFEAEADCNTALHFAASHGHAAACRTLIKAGADPNTKSIREHSAADLAVSHGRGAVLRVFTPSPSDADVADAMAALDEVKAKANGGAIDGVAVLLEAAASGTIETAQAVLREQPGLIDGSIAASVSAVHLAARGGHLALLRDVLLPCKANLLARTERGCTPLALAAEEGHADFVVLLLEEGANANLTALGGVTPLMLAVSNGHVEVARVLREAGASADSRDDCGYTTLMLAARFGSKEIMRLLLDCGVALDVPLQRASAQSKADQVGIEADPSHRARGTQHPHTLHRLALSPMRMHVPLRMSMHGRYLSKSTPVSAPLTVQAEAGFTALTFACRFGHLGAAQLLVTHGATIDARTKSGFSPLQYACQFGHQETLSAMIELKADVNHLGNGGWHALFDACMNGHDEIVRELCSAGANVNHGRTNSGFTALMFACQHHHEAAAVALLELGADPNQLNTKSPSESAVQICVKEDAPNVLQAVLAAGGSHTKVRGSTGSEPLHAAASGCKAECVHVLLRHGAEVDVTESDSKTALLLVVEARLSTGMHQAEAAAVVTILIQCGANVNKADASGRTPLQLALDGGLHTIAELLRTAGATEPAAAQPQAKAAQPATSGFTVSGAGSSEVNGFYERDGEYGGAPLYKNGQWWLLRYVMKSGSAWWYIADKDSLDSNDGDMYRVKHEGMVPPTDVEWMKAKDGVVPAPTLIAHGYPHS